MENASAQERIGQFLFRVGCDDDNRSLFCFDGFLGFRDVEFHFVQFPQKVIGEFQIGLVDLVDQEDHLFVAVEGFPQFAQFYVFCDIVNAFVAELGVIQTLYHVVNVQTVLRLCGGFDVPDHEFFAQRLRNGFCQHGFACAGFAFDQQRFLQGNGDIYGTHQLFAGYVVFAALKCHIHNGFPPFFIHFVSKRISLFYWVLQELVNKKRHRFRCRFL